jgi:hypothetical protein
MIIKLNDTESICPCCGKTQLNDTGIPGSWNPTFVSKEDIDGGLSLDVCADCYAKHTTTDEASGLGYFTVNHIPMDDSIDPIRKGQIMRAVAEEICRQPEEGYDIIENCPECTHEVEITSKTNQMVFGKCKCHREEDVVPCKACVSYQLGDYDGKCGTCMNGCNWRYANPELELAVCASCMKPYVADHVDSVDGKCPDCSRG